MTVEIKTVEQQSVLLGRQMVHDERSRSFVARSVIDRTTWRDKAIRVYDPIPNPNQPVGCCTMCAKAMQLNSVGNRRTGRVLNLPWALGAYTVVTAIDEFEGQWPPDDTGSSGLASCKAAEGLGVGGEYRWIFDGADGVIQEVMAGRVVSVGTWWYWDMFNQDSKGFVTPTGGRAGGHQYVIRGYDKSDDAAIGRCWWGGFRDFKIKRALLDGLLRDDGDAHFQRTT